MMSFRSVFLLLVLAWPGFLKAQEIKYIDLSSLPGDNRADPLTLLKQVGQRYANATFYHIEAVTEEQMIADFSKNWSKSIITAIVAPGNKYRFEAHTNWEWWDLVSDGKTEWLYSPATQEYKKQAAPVHGASRFKSSGLQTFIGLTDAQDTIEHLAELALSGRSAAYLPDETLTVNGNPVTCYVIEVQGKYRPGWSPDNKSLITFWVAKEDQTIRRVRESMEGPLIANEPEKHYISDKATVYSIVELHAPPVPDNLLKLELPPTARLVEEFQSPQRPPRDTMLVGKPAPDVNLSSTDGKVVSLRSFQGKPLLLDFWATWCGPCIESMPSVKQLYNEAAVHGLVLVSIDEDDDATKATEFLSENKESWPNFHDDGEIARVFPNEGIPHFVLIDSTGKVVFSKSSFDEPALRTAIAKLGPEFASLAKSPSRQ
jgi:thiol-disulfide isomerase/thioredoxin/outer membrane lipoprotein-sorting protein